MADKGRCPVCKEKFSLRNGKLVYHKVRWHQYNFRAVPCQGTGRLPQDDVPLTARKQKEGEDGGTKNHA